MSSLPIFKHNAVASHLAGLQLHFLGFVFSFLNCFPSAAFQDVKRFLYKPASG